MSNIEMKNIDQIFAALERQISAEDGKPISLVVCGGTALAALNLVNRTTKDVDVLGEAFRKGDSIEIKELNTFPLWLIRASKTVERDFNLPENWLNLGPASSSQNGSTIWI